MWALLQSLSIRSTLFISKSRPSCRLGPACGPPDHQSSMVKRFLPLEANPDVLNAFTANLGLDTSKFSFCDVYGLDEVLA